MLGENVACATVSLHPYILDDAHAHQELKMTNSHIVQELCESRGGRPNEPSGFRGRKYLLNRASALVATCP